MDCSDREFTSIPDIHATTLTLNLSRNDIDTIPTRAFLKLSKLQSLDLRRNKIWRVESLAFEGLVNLTVINLSLNIIDRIPTQAFLKLSKLQSLNLLDNQIRTFDPLAFEGLGNLIDINLSKNNISTIPTHALSMLSKLESLDLSWNQIHTVDPLAFEGLESLIDINFRWNLLSEVPSIGSQPRLSKLDLSWNRIVNATFPSSYRSSYYNLSVDLFCNKIESLDRFTFSSLAGTTIVDMDLSNNFISYVGPDTFVPLTSIETLNLGYNTLSKVPSIGFLSRVSKLDLSANRIVNATFPSIYRCCYNNISVDLSDNKIETLDRFTFSSLAGTTIVAMNLFRNNILSVGPGTFDPLTSIETLNLDYNKLSEVSFIGSLSRVSNLHLSGNSIVNATFPFIYGSSYNNISVYLSRNKITTLDKFTFSSLADTTIVEMDLSYNNISSVGPGTFDPLVSIEHLRLYENVLSEVPSIGSLPRLSELHLSYNRIVNATFPSTYRNTYNIISIYLSWNKIETLDRFTFSSLAGTTIVDMDLSFNNISYVGPGTFDPLESIERLYLCYNPLSNEALKNVADSCSRKQVTLAFGNLESLINGISAFMNSGIHLGMCASYSSGCVFEEFQNLTIIWLTKHDLVRISELDFPGKKNVLAMDLAENVFLSFPKYLPTSLESLDLRGNEISELNQNELSYLGSLRTLLLTRNRIVDLWSGAFNGLGNLRELHLAQNRIGTVSRDLFDPLQNLTHLYLCKNGLNYLPKLSEPLVSLRVLDLSENAIDTVDRPFSESFPSLQILQLDGNNLGEPVFQSDRGGHLFTGLIKLNEVSISRNNIHNLPDMLFQDQVSLKNLNISNNQISGWGPNMFKFTRNFAKLDISFNLIPFLAERKLHDLNNLKKLHMKGNPFICNCDFHLLFTRQRILHV